MIYKASYKKEFFINLIFGFTYLIPMVIAIIWIPRVDLEIIKISVIGFILHLLINTTFAIKRKIKKEIQITAGWHVLMIMLTLIGISFWALIEMVVYRGIMY